jgi:hypothetical protein
MCWNPDISINTFVFSILAVIFIFWSNTFTKYKIRIFENPLMYVFLVVVASVQLMEFFLWRNLKNEKLNVLFSKMLCFLVMIQPVIIICMVPYVLIKIVILLSYVLFLCYIKYINPIIVFHTSIGKNGHLYWEWVKGKNYDLYHLFVWLSFYLIPVLLINNYALTIFLVGSIVASLYFNVTYYTYGSIWCWLSNLFILWLIINILIIQPYVEYNKLC